MEIWKTLIGLACGAAVFQSIFLGGFLGMRGLNRTQPSFWISLMLVGLGLRIGKSVFYYLLPKIALFGVVLGGVGLWLIGPAFWMYVKSSRGQMITKADLLHFVPALVVLFLGGVFRMEVLIPAYHIGAFWLGVYLVGAAFYWYKKEGSLPKGMVLISGSLIFIWLSFVFQYFSPTIEWYAISGAVSCLVLYVINFYIMRDQHIFKLPSKPFTVSEKISDSLIPDLERLFGEGKIYREKGLTVARVADALDRPAYLISKTINGHYGLRFNEFVNTYRVKEVKERLQDLERNHKVEAIAEDVGFSSTSSLYHAFKKETQLTLQQYRSKFSAQQAG